jgi:class 3 adenylate cyclase
MSHVTTSSTGLVGRGRELAALMGWLEEARAGIARAALISGEAGIGKTRLSREFMASAEAAGFRTVFGRCISDSAIPYTPFTTALIPELDRAGLLDDEALGASSSVLRRLLPGAAAAAPAGDSDAGAMLQAIPAATLEFARQTPLLFVVDDLHWADENTLAAFSQLVMTAADASAHQATPLFVVALHRPAEPRSRFAEAHARLLREDAVREIEVSGLDEAETNELVFAITNSRCSPRLLGDIYEATGGNPLFVIEALGHLERRQALDRRDGLLVSAVPPGELPLPAEVTAAIADRVQLLDSPTRALLAVAALLDELFTLESFQVAAEVSEDEALEALEVGIRKGLIAEDWDGFRFAHPTMRHALATSLSAVRRRRLHRDIGRRIVDRSDGSDRTVLEVAHHFLAAGKLVDDREAGPILARAGAITFGLFAWSKSARFYDAALECGDWVSGLPAAVEADLLCRSGLSLAFHGDEIRARDVSDRAAVLAESIGLVPVWGESLVAWAKTFTTVGEEVPDEGRILRFLEADTTGHEAFRARAMSVLADHRWICRAPNDLETAREALDLARESHDDIAIANSALVLGNTRVRVFDMQGANAAYGEVARAGERIGGRRPTIRSWGPARMAHVRLVTGEFRQAEALAHEAAALSLSCSDWGQAALALAAEASALGLQGRIGDAERVALRAMIYLQRTGSMGWQMVFPLIAWLRHHSGRREAARDAARLMPSSSSPTMVRIIASLVGDGDEGSISQLSPWLRGFDSNSVAPAALIAHTCADAGIDLPKTFPFDALATVLEHGVLFAQPPGISLRRALGCAWSLVGDSRGPVALAMAVEECAASGAVLELGLSLHSLARVQLQSGQDSAAQTSAERALAVLAEIGAWGAHARVVNLLTAHGRRVPGMAVEPAGPAGLSPELVDALQGYAEGHSLVRIARTMGLTEAATGPLLRKAKADASAATPEEAARFLDSIGIGSAADFQPTPLGMGDHTRVSAVYLFTDIDNSTQLNQYLGDDRYADVLDAHNLVLQDLITESGGMIVKHTGDGFFARFADPTAAARCAVRIKGAFADPVAGDAAARLEIAVGLHIGEAIEVGNDLYGLAVSVSHSICDLADGGEVLVSEDMLGALDRTGLRVVSRGRIRLKGSTEPVSVYELIEGTVPQGEPEQHLLSHREREVLAHAASGKSNAAIADELVLSVHTVARHMANIYNKIDVDNRTAAARWAVDHGIG